MFTLLSMQQDMKGGGSYQYHLPLDYQQILQLATNPVYQLSLSPTSSLSLSLSCKVWPSRYSSISFTYLITFSLTIFLTAYNLDDIFINTLSNRTHTRATNFIHTF